mgnify:FL=1
MHALRTVSLLRLWLLALALFLGQAAMLAHGAEHLDGGDPPHACRLCLLGQNVDGPVPPASIPVFEPPETFTVFSSIEPAEASSVTITHRHARGPPRP